MIDSEGMDENHFDYGELIDEAMHYVVRRALQHAETHGLPGDHHFFITFATRYPGVMLADELLAKYPEEMTIVVQHQYWDLEVEEDRFSIVLSFENVKQNLTIPFESLVSFADPSVKFGLQFNQDRMADEDESDDFDGEPPHEPITDGSNVITLDSFRKK